MSEALSGSTGAATIVSTADIVRHKPGRRAIARLTTDRGTLYAKMFASSRGPKVHAISQTICDARAFGPDVALPVPVAYLPELRTLVQKRVAGEPIEDALTGGDTALARRIAEALHRFHISGADLGRRHDLAKELAPLPGRVAEVIDTVPELESLAHMCLQRVRAGADMVTTWRLKPVHRDCYHDQFLVDGGRLAVLDLDDAAMSEPAVDIANVAAHLMLLGAQRSGDMTALAPVIDVFIARCRSLDPELDASLMRYLTGTTLVRLAGIHVARRDGATVAGLLLNRAAAILPAR